MKAIILAAGKATRLRPLTSSLPKCLLVVGGKTILDHQIEAMVDAKIKELILVVGFQKQKIYDHLSHKKYPIKITYVENDSYSTTGPILGGLLLVREHIKEPFIFFHCDVLFKHDALTHLIKHPHGSVMLHRERHWDEEAGKINVCSLTGGVKELGKHLREDQSTGEYLQIAKFDGNFGKHLTSIINERSKNKQDGYTIDAFNDVVQRELATVTGLSFTGFCMEIDNKEDYDAAKKPRSEPSSA